MWWIILLIILGVIGYLLFPIIKIVFRVRRLQKQMQEQFDAFNRQNSAPGYEPDYDNEEPEKIFDDSMGEYVEFEEIEEDEYVEEDVSPAYNVPRNRVEDAEWEDIK
ncbi:MAG: hypothetical protein ACI31F_07785 [Muribaculaceae bacterium]